MHPTDLDRAVYSSPSAICHRMCLLIPNAPEGQPLQAKISTSKTCAGKKSLPGTKEHERFFGFVEAVDTDISKLTEGLGPQEYQTQSSGSRTIDPSRTLGEGRYAT